MDSSLRALLLLGTLVLPEAWAGSHSLRYFFAAWTRPELGRPRCVAVSCVDEQEFESFDSASASRSLEPRAAWMKRVVLVDPHYWEQGTRSVQDIEQIFESALEALRRSYNQSRGGVHTLQATVGCEASPAGRFLRGSLQFAYDGLDYISLDTDTWTWTAAQPQAEISKRKLEAESCKPLLEVDCVLWLQELLEIGQEALTRTDPPSARVTRHTAPHGEVTLRCRAQDFYPSQISLTWLRDGEEQLQDTEFIETRPGGDGTFQKWAAVGVPPGQEGSYTCRVQHQGLAEPLSLKWEPPSTPTGVIVGVLAGALLLTGSMAGVVIWRKKS